MIVTPVQMAIRDGEPEHNLQHALELLNAAPRSDIYLLPELCTTGYAFSAWDSAADQHTPLAVDALTNFAIQRNAIVVAGTIARNRAGRLVNRLWMLGGDTQKHYDKIHLIAAFREPELLERGAEPCAARLHSAHLHLSICFDLRFPELYRAAALDGAELFLVISEWPARRADALVLLARARAMENQAYLALCNRTGTAADGTEFDGRSQIIDPEGNVLAAAAPGEGYCSAHIDPATTAPLRERFPVLQWSRRAW